MTNRILTTLLAAAATMVAGLVAVVPPASAAAGDNLGHLFVAPSSGVSVDPYEMNTSATCPVGATFGFTRITGSGIVDDGTNGVMGVTALTSFQSNSSGGYALAASATLRDTFLNLGVTPVTGDYTLVFTCRNASGSIEYGDFTGIVHLTVSEVPPNDFTWAQPSLAVGTTTSVVAAPVGIIRSGASTTLTATVTQASGVTKPGGTVRFKRNGANLGTVQPVTNGVATLTTALAAGSSSLTAEFTPADINAFGASASSPVSYLAVNDPIITGTPAVGSALTCGIAPGGMQEFSWSYGGAVSPLTGPTITVPASWAGTAAQCAVKTTANGGTVVTTSAPTAPIPPSITTPTLLTLKATARPKIVGTRKVGKVLKCTPGTWSPAGANTYKYKWKRGTKVLPKAVSSKYKVTKLDKRKSLSCVVTATRGPAKGTATSAAAKIK